jgi:apolipoprotein N-acyltransferase
MKQIDIETLRDAHLFGRIIRTHAWAAILGGSLSAIGFPCWDWRWWAVFVPTLIGVYLRPNAKPQADAAQTESNL